MLPGPVGASATQESQTPQGSGVGPLTQFSERARIRALDVLPQPRGPLNRYAWLIRPVRSACWSGPVTCSCPLSSANVAGRYLRYSARPDWARLAGVVSSLSDAPAAISPSPPVIGTGNRRTPRTPIRARVPLLPSGPGGVGGSNAVRGVIGQCSQTHDQMCVLRPRPGAPCSACWRFRVSSPAEDSPSGLGRTLGKRVGGNPSRVRISYPPPNVIRWVRVFPRERLSGERRQAPVAELPASTWPPLQAPAPPATMDRPGPGLKPARCEFAPGRAAGRAALWSDGGWGGGWVLFQGLQGQPDGGVEL